MKKNKKEYEKYLHVRDWNIVELINKHNGGIHNKKYNRSFKKQELKKKINNGQLDDI